jgi:hypothetical protein
MPCTVCGKMYETVRSCFIPGSASAYQFGAAGVRREERGGRVPSAGTHWKSFALKCSECRRSVGTALAQAGEERLIDAFTADERRSPKSQVSSRGRCTRSFVAGSSAMLGRTRMAQDSALSEPRGYRLHHEMPRQVFGSSRAMSSTALRRASPPRWAAHVCGEPHGPRTVECQCDTPLGSKRTRVERPHLPPPLRGDCPRRGQTKAKYERACHVISV